MHGPQPDELSAGPDVARNEENQVPQKPPSSLEDTKHQWLKDYERESAQMRPLFKPWKEPNRLTWFGHTDQTMKSITHSNMPPS
jgi:hypothetical protein